MEGKERKIGVILSYVAIIINTFLQLLYTPFLTSHLGQSEYGLYSLVSSLIGYLTVLDLGFSNAIVIYTAKYRAQKKEEEMKKLHGMFFLLFCAIGVFASILGLILYFQVPTMFGNSMNSVEIEKAKIMMLILTFNLSVTFPLSIYASIISAYEKFVFQKGIAILSALLKPLLMLPLLFLGYKSISLTLVITGVNLFVLASNYIYCKKNLKLKIKFLGFDKKLFWKIFSYSFFIFLGTIVDKINWSVDQFILGAVSGTVAVSLYAVASQINNLFVSLSSSVNSVFLPKITKMIAQNCKEEELSNEFIKIGRLQFYFIFLLVSGFSLFGKNFIELWVGPQYHTSYYITLILIIPLSLAIIQNIGLSILQAKNLYHFRSILYVFLAIFNVVISIFLAKEYGGVGSALGTSIALLIGNVIIMNIYYFKKVQINVLKFWKEILKLALPLLLPIGIILVVEKVLILEGIWNLLCYGSLFVLLYAFIAIQIMNPYEKSLILGIVKKIRR